MPSTSHSDDLAFYVNLITVIFLYFSPKLNSGSGLQQGNRSNETQLSLFTLVGIRLVHIFCLESKISLSWRNWKSHHGGLVACTTPLITTFLIVYSDDTHIVDPMHHLLHQK